MPSEDETLKVLQTRLNALVKCVIAKAKEDSEFAAELHKSLFANEQIEPVAPKPKSRPPKFEPVGFLSEHGSEELRRALLEKGRSELVDIARFHRVVDSKTLKTMGQNELVESIAQYAARKLNQGGVFLRPGPAIQKDEDELADSVTRHAG